jgi:hypothetical protein
MKRTRLSTTVVEREVFENTTGKQRTGASKFIISTEACLWSASNLISNSHPPVALEAAVRARH